MLETATRIGFENALLAVMSGQPVQPIVGPGGAEIASPARMGKLQPKDKARRLDNITERLSLDTALIHVDGVIDKHITQFEMDCFGGYDLRDFDSALVAAARDPDLRNVLLVMNSPGGSVTGVPESAQRVADLAKSKNVFAFADGLCCSAAYYIASQADQVFGTPSSDVGSIGVYMALVDATRRLEDLGLKVNEIKDGEYKTMGAPWKELTEKERAMFQAEVSKIGTMFRDAVNSKRPDVTNETMQGQSFFGDNALEAGLVDAIMPDLSAVLAEF